jgi:ubiquinone/menaquinone biosynthesis C-methylase UbiE
VNRARSTWPWQRLNEGNVSSHETLAALLEPRAGERWLDIGTGGGGLAFLLAERGAVVVGVDIADDGLAHARTAAGERGLEVDFRRADAQDLPFADGEFDGVTSAFGAIFAPDHDRAAAELARVCRPGGKLGLTLMPLDSRTGEMFSVLARYGGWERHPGQWSETVERLLGDAFELELERRESPSSPAREWSWDEAVETFAPLRELVERLDESRANALRAELEDVVERYRDVTPSYVLVVGRRR